MVDYRKLLDAFIGAIGRPDQQNPGQPAQGGMRQQVERSVTQVTGQSPDQLLQKAKNFATQHPGLTQTALIGLAGLLFRGRKKSKLTGNLVKLGGLAVIGGLAYKAYQGQQAGKGTSVGGQSLTAAPAMGETPAVASQASVPQSDEAVAQSALSVPETSRFHPVSQTEDDALLFLRTMVAAAAADGQIDEAERSRIVKGLTEAGIDPDATRWLDTEMASPADVEELAANVNDPEKAAQVYSAARIAIDPDTIQEREFLNQLAEALDLEPAVRSQIDDTAGALT
ncbi:tellurite resistance TerB family protein [Microvirga sp. CF3062]|uniref:tellurite resistance TerB family protein n=1 Tax=Microvirga sp. CF3062 TaxID=3110182 RepID=UPI002E75E429|nr:tellurite resistance TerB family protein [Microvirga sp. CF3062]MEE1657450.1 tellurite resistance TerB family protein [Microvirga sp. CF3062]